MKRNLKLDYKKLVKHVREWEKKGLAWGIKDLLKLEEMYTENDDGDNFIVGDYDQEDDKK